MSHDRRPAQEDETPVKDAAMSRKEFAEFGGKRLVYVRPVMAVDVADELADDDGDLAFDLPEDAVLYSVHAANGDRIALVGDRALAFAAARQHGVADIDIVFPVALVGAGDVPDVGAGKQNKRAEIERLHLLARPLQPLTAQPVVVDPVLPIDARARMDPPRQ